MTLPQGGENLGQGVENTEQQEASSSTILNKKLVQPFADKLNFSQKEQKVLDDAITETRGDKNIISDKLPKVLNALTKPENLKIISEKGIKPEDLSKDISFIVSRSRINRISIGKFVTLVLSRESNVSKREALRELNETEKIAKNKEYIRDELKKTWESIKAKNAELKGGELGKVYEEQKGQMNLPTNFEQQFNQAKESKGLADMTMEDFKFSLFVKEQAKNNPNINVDQEYLDNVQSVQDALDLNATILMPEQQRIAPVESTVTGPTTMDTIGNKQVYSSTMENYEVALDGLDKDLQFNTEQIDSQITDQTQLLGLFAFPYGINSSSLGTFQERFKDSLSAEEIKQVQQWSVALTYLSTPKENMQQDGLTDPNFVGWRNQLEQNGQLATTKAQIEKQLITMGKKVIIDTCDVEDKPMEMYMNYLGNLFEKQGDKYQIDSMKYNPDGSMTFDVHTKNLEGKIGQEPDAQIVIKDGMMTWKSMGMNTESFDNTMQVMEEEVTDNIATLKDLAVKPDLKPLLERANGYEEPVKALGSLYKENYETTANEILDSTKSVGLIQGALEYHTTKGYFEKGMMDVVTNGLYGQLPGENKNLAWRDDIKKTLSFDKSKTVDGRGLDMNNYPEQASALRLVYNTSKSTSSHEMENMLANFQNSIVNFRKKGFSDEDLQKSPEPLISELFTSEKAERPETMSNLLITMSHTETGESSRNAVLSASSVRNISQLLNGYSPDKLNYTLENIAPDFLKRPGTNIEAFEKLYEQKTTNGLDADLYYASVFDQLPDRPGDVAYRASMSKFEQADVSQVA